ncbi:MAG: hypothetical protein JXA25_00840, partial [Anaerolineales bacterium]|nr:hypothetical protein [Anaerolineales bacterium]
MQNSKAQERFDLVRRFFRPQDSDPVILRARMLTGITAFMLVAFAGLWFLYGLLFIFTGYFPEAPDLFFSLVPLLFLIALLFMIRGGHTNAASIALITFMIIWIAAMGYFEGHPTNDPILMLGLLLVVVFSLAVLQENQVWYAIGSAGAAYLFLIALWFQGYLPSQVLREAIPSALVTAFSWMFCAVSVAIIVNSLLRGLMNQTEILEQRVQDRTKNLENATAETNELNRAMLNMLEDLEEGNQLLQEQKEELAAVNRELASFSYSVSHDLRAPLRAMDGFSRILTEDYSGELSPEADRYLGLIRRNAQQMGQLIDDLLAYSRSSRIEIRRALTDPAQIVRQVWEELTTDRDMASVQFTQYEMPACYADPLLLKQVYQNLLENALKYSSPRSPIRIE